LALSPKVERGQSQLSFSPAGEKVAVRPDEGARLATAKYSAKKNRNTNPLTLALSPEVERGQSQLSFSPAGEKVAVRPDEGAQPATAKYSAKKNRNTNPSP